MKELSIEEKAKRYDEAIEIAKEWYSDAQIGIGFKANLEKLFSELKESEDERIRKELLDMCKTLGKSEWIAWLEKQGNIQLPTFTFDDVLALQCCMWTVKKVQEDKELYSQLQSLHSRLYDAYWLEKQGEQDKDNKFIRMRETKPKDISEFLDRLTTIEQEFLWEHIAKIRELDKEEHKPAWSEEDDRMLTGILLVLETYNRQTMSRIPLLVPEYISWLKSLRPQNRWKPSEEQMKVLRYLDKGTPINDFDRRVLHVLIDQLKKLTE